MAASREILVTSALPYANGPIHIGHLVEYIQTDIWVRFQRMRGHHCTYVCADDAHGTPIMLRARQEGIEPEELIARVKQEHTADFAGFHIGFDNFHSTHTPENRECAELIYSRLKDSGHITSRTIPQAFDPQAQMFLPDRFIRGTCPRCGADDQYGDSCEQCGATYTPTDLKDAVSVISGARPVERASEHFFVKLGDFTDLLKGWVDEKPCLPDGTHFSRVQPEIAHKLDEWFGAGLRDWDISRDAPYFGFEIPGETGKYFYVWLDAPIGYMASFKHLCARRDDLDFDHYFKPDSDTEMYHFIGKDIAYFHTLFWPAQLSGGGFRTPTAVFVHGFLTVNGQKMSKSRGTFIKARTYLEHLNPEYLRYYFACKLSGGIDDMDLSMDDFVQRVNADLVGKVVNIASRCAGFITRKHGGILAAQLDRPDLYTRFVDQGVHIAALYEAREFGKAVRETMALADLANQYIDDNRPWELAKQPENAQRVQDVCTMGINLFRVLLIYLKPILPAMSETAEAFLQESDLTWSRRETPLLGTAINKFKPLLTRVDPKAVAAMVDDSKEELKPAGAPAAATSETESEAEEIDIQTFMRVDLRVAEVLAAEPVEGAEKLLKLTLNLGNSRRTVFSGIKSAYRPEDLVGRMTVVAANLKPRKMSFGVSEGMILAAGEGGSEIWLVAPDSGAKPGMRVR